MSRVQGLRGKLASPAWAMAEYGWYPLLLFAFTPWFLYRLGTELYGHWMLLTAAVGLGGVLSAGTGAATIKAISAGKGRNSRFDSERIVNASLAMAVIGGGVLALLVSVIFWAGGASLFSRMGDVELVRLTGVTAAALIWLEQLDNVFSSAMKGAEFFSYAARVEILSKTAQVVAAAFVLLGSPVLWSLYAVLLVVGMLRLSAKILVARRLLGIGTPRLSLTHARDILHFAKWGWIQGAGAVMFGVVDRILIGALLGANSLTYYSIASQLAMQVHAVSSAGLSVIFPKVSRMLEHGKQLSLWRVTKAATAGNLLLSSSLALILIVLGPTVLRLWIGTEAALPTAQLLPWLVLAYWILALNIVFYYVLLGMGRIRFVAITVLLSASLAVVAVYVGITYLGLMGTPAGRGLYALLSLAVVYPVVQEFRRDRNLMFIMPPLDQASSNERLQ